MYDFIVGGYLPGTNIQISYKAWIGIYTVLFGLIAIGFIEYKQRSIKLSRFFSKNPGVNASELHRRLQYPAV